MKIDKIYINAFGGLRDFTLSFNDNLNIIFGENENGKTTVLSFVKAMFYGTGKKTSNLSNSIRVKYAPFDGSQMGGRIYFEHQNKKYCLERQFNKSNSTDKIMLTNLDTGESVAETNDIGVRIFGMGAEAFSNSMFIGSERNYAADEVASGELNSRLSSIALTGDETTSFQKIEKRITDSKEKIISKSGRTGSLVKAKAELEELNLLLEKSNEEANRKIEISEEISRLKEQGIALSEEYMKLKKLSDSKDDIKNAEKAKEYVALKEELDEINKGLALGDGSTMDSSLLSKYKFAVAKLEPQKEKCDLLIKDIEELEKEIGLNENMSEEESEAKISELNKALDGLKSEKEKSEKEIEELISRLAVFEAEAENTDNYKKKFNPILFIIGIICLVAGIIAGILFNKLLFISGVAGLILTALAFVIRPNDESKLLSVKENIADTKEKTANLKSSTALLAEEIATKSSELNILLSIKNADGAVRQRRKEEIEQKKLRFEEENEKYNQLLNEYKSVLESFDFDSEKLSELEAKVERQKNIKLKLNYLAKDLGDISLQEAKVKSEIAYGGGNSQIDFEQVNKKREEIGEKLTELKQEITALDTELKTSFKNSAQPGAVMAEIRHLKEKIKHQQDFVDCCDLALETLLDSFSSVRRGYGKVLEESTLDIFKKLTNGRYKSVNIDKSLNMTVESADIFGMREMGYLSTGTEDQAYLSMRLAICRLISDNEAIPVMLDDALSNYDDKRTLFALDYLKSYSEDNQVLLFTCHNSIVNEAEKLGIAYKEFKSE